MSRPKELGQPGFTIYWEDLEGYLFCLDDEAIGSALRLLWLKYDDAPSSELPVLDDGAFLMYWQLKQKIDIQCDKYEETCQRNREIAQKREAAKAAK